MAAEETVYRVVFVNEDKVYELYVRHVFQSDLWGFLELEGFVFGSRSELVVDPSEEKLRQQFGEVKRTYIPMHAVIRIDEVRQTGVAKISEAKGTITPFPSFPPKKS